MSPFQKLVWTGEVLRTVDWLIPAFQTVAFTETLARAIEISPEHEKLEVLRESVAAIYSPPYLAAMYLHRYIQVPHISEFANRIDESFRVFFSGYRSAAVTLMIPVLEGVLRKVATSANRNVGHGTKGLIVELEKLVEEEKSSPERFDERLFMFELLLDFMRDKFLKNTDLYTGHQNFNRHGILHGVFGDFDEDLNFFRTVMLLDFLLLILIYRRLAFVSVFTPAATDESRALAAEYSNLRPVSAPKLDSREIVVVKLLKRIGSHMMENPADYPEFTEAVQKNGAEFAEALRKMMFQ
ncbi:hypothetical protein [Acidocella sp. MX-AZ02]|uniref:hypothetical protein n=1 Tax=Acidocella sp. MX-AZ02 TaxID=1214225 RepID=UPI00196A0B20|nr:hypothetical protein [Acidocella sp. MX-AZ02]